MSENEKERINAAIQCDQSRIYAAKKLSKWFSIYFRIQIFGQTILEFDYPQTLFDQEQQKGGQV